jgi:hypothetical protein
MNEIELKKLWDKLQGKLNFGTFDSFKSKMNTVDKRKTFFDKYYEQLKNDYNLNLGEYNDFEKRLSTIVNPPPNPNQQTQTSGLPTWTTNYPCLLNSKLGTPVKTTSDTQVLISFSTGDKLNFWENKCLYTSKNGEKFWGDWSCESDKIYIKYNDGTVFDGDKVVRKSQTTEKEKTGNTSRKSKYTECPETLPIKQYCKNETVRKIQACLKMPKRYQTGNFGPITQEYLESRDQNGILMTTETIIAVCAKNDPLVQGLGTSGSGVANVTGAGTTGAVSKPQSKTGYEDYTFDEIEYSDNTQNVKSSTPSSEKPEGGETSTGYEGYSDEDTNKPTTQKTTQSTSNINSVQQGKKSFIGPLDNDQIQ